MNVFASLRQNNQTFDLNLLFRLFGGSSAFTISASGHSRSPNP
jgi:hypothetical protein